MIRIRHNVQALEADNIGIIDTDVLYFFGYILNHFAQVILDFIGQISKKNIDKTKNLTLFYTFVNYNAY